MLAALGVAVLSASCSPRSPRQATPVVRQVDHVLIASRAAGALFSLLTDTFQLPVAWPMSDYGGFASGGVSVGNVNLEVLRGSPSTVPAGGSRCVGMALEPEPLGTSLAELRARGIPHGNPGPFRSSPADGPVRVLWTTVALPEVSGETVEVFLCEYGHDVPGRRGRLLGHLEARGGGPLSIRSLREIVVGARDGERTRERWQRLLDPLPRSPGGGWQVGGGPGIRVVQADTDGIRELVLDVRSLAQARDYLKEKGLLGTDRPDALQVAGPALQGLTVTLIEGP